MVLVRGPSLLHNVFVHATRTDGAHLQFLKDLKEFLIKESRIEWHHNRSILSIAPADSWHPMANHLLNRVRVVAVKKTYHRSPEKKIFLATFNGRGITLILLQIVECGQARACVIQEKAKQLLENLINRKALPALSHTAKKPHQIGQSPYVFQITDEKAQTSPMVSDVDST